MEVFFVWEKQGVSYLCKSQYANEHLLTMTSHFEQRG